MQREAEGFLVFEDPSAGIHVILGLREMAAPIGVFPADEPVFAAKYLRDVLVDLAF